MSRRGFLVVVTLALVGSCLVFMIPQMGRSTPYGKVTEMRLHAQPPNYNGPCPATITFRGLIRVDGPNTVTYGITRSDGGTGEGPQRLNFRAAGSRPVSFTWSLGRPGENYDGWAEIGSGDTRSNRAQFHLHCRR